MNKLSINYSDQNVIHGDNSIFLAGPTPRNINVETWRKEALSIIKDLDYNGIVYVPEKEFDDRTFDYTNQVWWEREALYNASVIAFWIPRNINELPAFTTNVEFGYWLAKNSDKVIYGRPDNAQKTKYLDWLYETETGKKPINNLKELLIKAINMANSEDIFNEQNYRYYLEKHYVYPVDKDKNNKKYIDNYSKEELQKIIDNTKIFINYILDEITDSLYLSIELSNEKDIKTNLSGGYAVDTLYIPIGFGDNFFISKYLLEKYLQTKINVEWEKYEYFNEEEQSGIEMISPYLHIKIEKYKLEELKSSNEMKRLIKKN